ncbi:hypothetical protein ACNQKP_18020 [Bdellovibrio bacteriovorus]|uniref:hypothetical protein n=1 Tax=Bdellovibrio bacteriovorus TaxID=959 RepID=UPI003AA97801
MESSVSTPHCSLIVYLEQPEMLPAYLRDLRGFFAKFPLNYEVIVVAEKGCVVPPTDGPVRVLQNSKKLGRAASLWQGLQNSLAPFSAITSVDMNTPLGDYFKLLQNLMTEENFEICWGDRYKKKDSPFLKGPHPRQQMEDSFNRILRDKFPQCPHDPLSEILLFKKAALEKLAADHPGKFTGWYLGPQLLGGLRRQQLRVLEIPVFESGQTLPGFSLWRQRWNLFIECAFKTS